MAKIPYADLELTYSSERFARYLAWADGDRNRAVELYTLNTQISEVLYIPLQTLELALRNRIHGIITEALHDRWFDADGFLRGDRQPGQLEKAINDIKNTGREAPGRIVAELTFSFWTAMFGTCYEDFWQTTLHRIGKKSNGKGLRRKDFAAPLTPIRTLRNRIAHHEPIIMWDIAKHHTNMIDLTEWVVPAAAAWCRSIDRFCQVYPSERIQLAADKAGR
ncbi:MAG: hypothetical protein QOD11_1930 [Bradyrhizobium sp.]|jgi:hypothetical protein|nr:hypothetical protein [Bradyrhizobium sp.]